jgi:hypothetical protein
MTSVYIKYDAIPRIVISIIVGTKNTTGPISSNSSIRVGRDRHDNMNAICIRVDPCFTASLFHFFDFLNRSRIQSPINHDTIRRNTKVARASGITAA